MTDRPDPAAATGDGPSAPEWEALARALDADDPAVLAAWERAHPEHAAFAALVRERMAAPEPKMPSEEATERALAAVRVRMASPALAVARGGAVGTGAPARRAPTPAVTTPARWRWGVPAALAAALAAVWVGGTGRAGPGAADGAANAAATAFATAQGVTDTLTL
ncbi:MAG: hypothetical protein KJT01_13015, partial [Gemmatimonadetes bacterium]|nr:hypothetical protein [Gemmatimonadota bacterium]